MSNLQASIVIEVVNRATAPIRRIAQSLGSLKNSAVPAISQVGKRFSALGPSVSDVGKRFSTATRETGMLAGKLAIIGGAGAWAFKSQLVDTASEFEQYGAILETVEGSSLKAKKSMDWVSSFAAKTPYEMGDVMDSFVKLKAYGLEPTNGLLKTLGDTSAAMGKPLVQAVEAMADAVTGEYERLKEFGVKAATKGIKTVFSYTDSQGKQRAISVDKNNRAMIESTLKMIWNERYAGAMEKQSRTWKGMISNIQDQWTRFTMKIMGSGLFDWMKTKLAGLLKTVDEMANSGALERLAILWGQRLKTGMEQAWAIGKKLWVALRQIAGAADKVATALGGYDNMLMLVASTMAIKAVASVVSLGSALLHLGTVILPATTMAFTTTAATGGTALAGLSTSLTGITAGLLPVLAAIGVIGGSALMVREMYKRVNEPDPAAQRVMMRDFTMNKEIERLTKKFDRPPDGQRYSDIPGTTVTPLTGEIHISIDSSGNPVLKQMKSSKNMDLTVDTGRIMKGY